MSLKTVVIGLSGGIDSAVSAYLLKKSQKFNVVALFMKNWDEYVNFEFKNNTSNKSKKNTIGCSAEQDFAVAQEVAQWLKIPIYRVNFVKEYWDLVFQKTLKIYTNGDTPNPDVLCNQFIKFDLFYHYARKWFKCDYIATGHYARKRKNIHGDYNLYISADEDKDQTYFLCQINKDVLNNVLFPIGDYTKKEIRALAKKIQIPNYDRKDSTGICFIGERNFKAFLNNYIPYSKGNIVDVNSKQVIGQHDGISFYTIGQRKGLNLGNLGGAYVVVDKDKKANTVFVAKISQAKKFLTSTELIFKTEHWINDPPPENKSILLRLRHRQKLLSGRICKLKNNYYLAKYPSGSQAVTPGQYVVVYSKQKRCYGGGEIISRK